jgi:magnesium transporter
MVMGRGEGEVGEDEGVGEEKFVGASFDKEAMSGALGFYLKEMMARERRGEGSVDFVFEGVSLERLHPSDVADMYEDLREEEREGFFRILGLVGKGEFISYLSDSVRLDVIRHLDDGLLVEVVSHLETDDAMEILEGMSVSGRDELFAKLPRQERIMLKRYLQFPEETVGRLMRQETVTVPEYWSAGQAIDFLRSSTDRLPEVFYTVVVVDVCHRPLGNVGLSDLLRYGRAKSVKDLLDDRDTVVSAFMDREDLAHRFRHYGLVEVSVVGENGRLVGVVTVDDVINVLHEEHEEDVLKQHGVGDGDIHMGVLQAAWGRFPWLVINLLTSVLASMVISAYSETIEQMVALAVMMPIVVSMGGNGGMQTLSLVLRGLATGEITSRNVWKVSKREMWVSVLNGVGCGFLTALIGYIWFGEVLIFVVVFLSVVLTLVVGIFAGMMLPVVLDRLGMDPTVSSTVVLTTVTDTIGFFSVLGIAHWLFEILGRL